MSSVSRWLSLYAAQVAELPKWLLTPAEHSRWVRLRQPEDKNRMISGVALAKYGVVQSGGSASNVERACATCGALDHGPLSAPGVSISVSHSDSLVVAAISDAETRIGIDLEKMDAFDDEIANYGFETAEELFDSGWQGSTGKLKLWTCKEALLKSSGRGLIDPLQNLSLSTNGGARPEIEYWLAEPIGTGDAAVELLEILPNYVGALAKIGRDLPETPPIQWIDLDAVVSCLRP